MGIGSDRFTEDGRPALPRRPTARYMVNHEDDLGPLYEIEHAEELERADRQNPIPGGEPNCPVCGARTHRIVEAFRSASGGTSPFRVRIVCSGEECRRWTVYDW